VKGRPASATLLWLALLASLLALRVPSVVQPAGGDQGLYVYEGQRVLAGDVPYRDVWDQKPPAIAFLYAAAWRIWPHESVVPLADLLAAAVVAGLLILIGTRRGAGTYAGHGAAAVYLLLSDPSMQTMGGVYVRGQCEPFIALAVTAAIAMVSPLTRRPWHFVVAGLFLAAAFWLKYNALAYALPIALAVWAWAPADRRTPAALARSLGWIAAGFVLVGAAFLAYFASHGALHDLWLATIAYNLGYSEETYTGATSVLTYPLRLVYWHAKVDMLWYLGSIGALLAAWYSRASRSTWVWIGWLAAAVVSIAINGQRGAPNYFVQAAPALACTCAAGFAALRGRAIWVRVAAAALVVAGLWRVGADPTLAIRWGGMPALIETVMRDVSYARGRLDRETYLGYVKGKKLDALAIDNLARHVRDTTSTSDAIFVFGFSGGSVGFKSGRESASRFFWSRPILIEFAAGEPGYGSAGLLADLQRSKPVLVALQREQWESERFFLQQPGLRAWLEEAYVLEEDAPMFSVWRRKL
jgi:hypothetical protein